MNEAQMILLLQDAEKSLSNVENILTDLNGQYIDLNIQLDAVSGNCSKLVELLRMERAENYQLRDKLNTLVAKYEKSL